MSLTVEDLAKLSTNQRVEELSTFAHTEIKSLSLEEQETHANQNSLAKQHLLSKEAQFSGMPEHESHVVLNNPDATKELDQKRPELNLSNRLTKQHQATPTPTPGASAPKLTR